MTERKASAARLIIWPWQRTRWWTGSYSLISPDVIRPVEVNKAKQAKQVKQAKQAEQVKLEQLGRKAYQLRRALL